ncbi:hypothetical protein FRZ67_18340 [Panacibacter ginsenosidivorans]|uniref:Uncharacterized protein n=1 Tax=Panacibacter ginsenosidivorans TaxID=1813871 RepID=A0A5B8VCJ2_9BACT|nr:hypothetical protein [Panacibacter ginsenosidivorans]QEC69174.1 hypothetical protein FRZ67_18340 [Panacibacter ginsenosidivorans]
MKLQDFISMLTSQLKEEEICHETAIRNEKFFQAHKIMQRITSLRKAINKAAAHSHENLYVSQVKFQLL